MNWLIQLVDKLFCWLPRLWLVEPDEAGVRTMLGRYKRVCPPGWYINWPIIHICSKIYVTPQVVDLRAQSILTADGHTIAVSGAVEYTVDDVEKALLKVCNVDVSLPNFILGIIADYVNAKTLEECHNIKAIKLEVKSKVARHVEDWGIKIQKIYITDIAEHSVYRVLGPLVLSQQNGI